MLLVSLLLRLPRRTALATVSLCVLAPGFVVWAYFLGSDQVLPLRSWHRYAPLAAILAALGIYNALQTWAMRRLYANLEEAISLIRRELAHLLSTSEVQVVKGVPTSQWQSVFNDDAQVAATFISLMSASFYYLCLLCVGLLATAVWAPWTLGLLLVVAVLAFLSRKWPADTLQQEADLAESRFQEVLHDILSVPRELAVDRRKALDIAASAEKHQRAAGSMRAVFCASQGATYALIEGLFACMILLELQFQRGLNPGAALETGLLLLFAVLQAPAIALVGNFDGLRAAFRAGNRLLILEAGLRAAPRVAEGARAFENFGEIRLEGVELTRSSPSRPSFQIGPLDLVLGRGSVTIVRGKNGSGKTSLMELLLGISRPRGGRIVVDGRSVEPASVQAYRSLFSPVFAMPHLFDEAPGHRNYDRAAAREWLDRLGLPADVELDASLKQTAALSTGQRKRLALARAILEDRPVLVLDEYTADQDQASRARFYAEVLPRLKAAGRTVLAIVHDDGVAECADQVLHMSDGKWCSAA
ncbi:MAG: ATP-binding cassette domain-containing protein [Planctomycetes bacterium]|nr:ATP-binding cassette domain-containing protein [Planctomycetota bacterium]